MSEADGPHASRLQPDGRPNIAPSSRTNITGNRFDVATIETGESSKRNSLTTENVPSEAAVGSLVQEATDSSHLPAKAPQDGRGSHRSHRSRGSASFLVSKSIFDPPVDKMNGVLPLETPPRKRESARDHKGKVVIRTPEKKHRRNRSSLGLGIGGSPLAATMTTAIHDHGDDISFAGGDGAQDNTSSKAAETSSNARNPAGLDVESAQIVSLALNLSESRRNATRRNISTPVLPTVTGLGEGFSGGSLRQHLQAQRKSSRNVSPKPERADRTFSSSPRAPSGQRTETPLQAAFGPWQDNEYQYTFSASTLARAEKAKKAIELMAQYRRLLQYVPPLKPQALTRTSTRSPPSTATVSQSHAIAPLSHVTSIKSSYRHLGRPYNPLQYIRNRKIRARERKAIDGEAQGFGDVDRVASWIDRVSKASSTEYYQESDSVLLPFFAGTHDKKATPTASPQSTLARGHGTASKTKRPRVDWMTDPADMLADAYWLEQDDHKKFIEDNRERKIFPQNIDLTRSVSRRGEEYVEETDRSGDGRESRLRLDTKLPLFNSLRGSLDLNSDSTRGRALQKLQSVTHPDEDSNSNSHQQHHLKSHRRSSSVSLESERRQNHSRHRRNATVDTQDLNGDVLEKQMLEILSKESRDNSWDVANVGDRQDVPRIPSNPGALDAVEKFDYQSATDDKFPVNIEARDGHERKHSRGSQHFFGRASLEVPGPGGRRSLDGLDTTAPSSPETKASKVTGYFVPSIGMDLSPPASRRVSPTRQPALARVKSKINPFHDRSRNHSRARSVRGTNTSLEREPERGRQVLDVPKTPDGGRRSVSSNSKLTHRKAEDSMVSNSSKTGSIRRRAEELPSGIRGLFKAGRNPVQRVSDLIWKKEMSPGSVASSGTSTDDSDGDDGKGSLPVSRTATTVDKGSKPSSREASGELSPLKEPRSYDLPVFTSPFQPRGRPRTPIEDTDFPESDYISRRQRVREQRRVSRFQLLKPPRIDVQSASPASSPDLLPRGHSPRDSDVSDIEDHRRSSFGVQHADARLNSILGIPGHVGHPGVLERDALPVTGLTHPHDSRQGSVVSKRQWSFSDRAVSTSRGPMTRSEIARVQALLLSSGIKAKEITRRAADVRNLWEADRRNEQVYSEIVKYNRSPDLFKPVARSQAHILAARILSNDIQLSSQVWQESASNFSNQTVSGLLDRVEDLQDRIQGRDGLSEMARKAEREADEVSKDLLTSKTMAVKEALDRMEKMVRRRRRRFRWVRRAGWVLLEWVLVGVMWWVWLVFIMIGFVLGSIRGIIGGVRWLLWL